MKKIVSLIALFSTLTVFSQAITVNTTTYSVPDLVNTVLINSPCLNATNVNWSTGTNFGSTNGIGYFENTNPNFPMQSGVILTTGNVQNAPGPNTSMLNDGTNAWPGDSSLESILAASGITMSSRNATVLEFNFTPISSHFDFDFLFASEEYGNFQCQFSDAFAFLLTNLNTGVTTNLAVVPGTSDPISVVTIRDFLYNSGCDSQNAQYFGTFNGGSNAANAAINYNGQTVVMNASAVLIPNTTYRIKLVIADRSDFQSDSAIFLSSNSFNIGQEVLGADLTVASNTALCFGESQTLNSNLDDTIYDFVWQVDNSVIEGETSSSLNISQAGTYQLTYTNTANPCQTITDTIIVEYDVEFVTPNPENLYKCNTGSATYSYNLAYNTSIVTAGLPTGTTVSYHFDSNDAVNNVNPLPLNYNSAGNQTIYVRINKANSSCYVVKSFDLLLSAIPQANSVSYVECSSFSQPGSQWFDLSSIVDNVLGATQSSTLYSVNFYLTQADATSGTNVYTDNNYFTANTTIYASVQLITDATCRATTPITLSVSSLPLVDDLEDVILCNSYFLPALTHGNYYTEANGGGLPLFAGNEITETQTIFIYNITTATPPCQNETSFRVTIIKPEELDMSTRNVCDSYTLPGIEFGSYFTEAAGAGTELPSGTVITTNQTIFFYYEALTAPFCVIDLNFDVVITASPNVPQLPNGFDCTSFILQPLSNGNYFDQPGGTGNQLNPGDVITTSKTIYVYKQNGICSDETSFEVVIGLNFPTDVSECVSYTLPQLVVGNYYTQPSAGGTLIPDGTEITTTQTIYIYAVSQSQPNCTDDYHFTVTIELPVIITPANYAGCDAYILPALTVGQYYTETNGITGTGTLLNAGDSVTASKTLYVYLNDGNGCVTEKSFDVTIFPPPVIDSRDDQTPCNSYILTSLANGNYYTGPNGTGTLLNGGDVITTSQTLYIYAVNANGCAAQSSFDITIFVLTADQLPDTSNCDEYILPQLSADNKYYTDTLGPNGTGTEIPAGTAITSTQTIYVYVESSERINCYDENTFTVTITPTPFVGNFPNVRVCESYTLPALTVGNYFTQTGGTGTQLNAGDLITINQTVFVYAQSTINTNCFDEKSFTVTLFNVDEIADVSTCESYILPTLTVGNYYNGMNGTGGMIPQGSSVTTTKTIYIYALSGFSPNCSDQTSFDVTIINQPTANTVPLSLRTVCDEDGTNDGITSFNLTSLDTTILGTQTGAEFNVAYFESSDNANNNTNSVTSTILTSVFVRVNNILAPNCFDVKPITLKVDLLPEPTPKDGIVCIDSETGTLIKSYTITSGLASSQYTFEWYDETGAIIGTGNNYETTIAGIFSLIATSNTTGCSSEEIFVTVNQSEPAVVAYTVSEDFSQNQTITVIATGTGGDYEYQLNDGLFQDSPIFENAVSGISTITVRDKNGCGYTKVEALVVNYPKYFTPNGDGIHDTWNIIDLKKQEDAVIFIFDRFGKILKQIYPSSQGWDGTYNGNLAISDDYWFTINYTKNQELKEFKAHFALKR